MSSPLTDSLCPPFYPPMRAMNSYLNTVRLCPDLHYGIVGESSRLIVTFALWLFEGGVIVIS